MNIKRNPTSVEKLKKWIRNSIGIAGLIGAVTAGTLVKIEPKTSKANTPAVTASQPPTSNTASKDKVKVVKRWSFEQYLKQNIEDMRAAGFFHKDDNIEFRIVDHEREDKDKSISSNPRENVPVNSAKEFEQLANMQCDVLTPNHPELNLYNAEDFNRNLLRIYDNVNLDKNKTTLKDLVKLHVGGVKASRDLAPVDFVELMQTTALTGVSHSSGDLKAAYGKFYLENQREYGKHLPLSFTTSDGVKLRGHGFSTENDPDVVGVILHDEENRRSFVIAAHHTWTQSESDRAKWSRNALEGMQLLVHDAHLALKEK